MTNTTSYVGFVVVFDARKQGNGNPLGAASSGKHTVGEILVDVRPSVAG